MGQWREAHAGSHLILNLADFAVGLRGVCDRLWQFNEQLMGCSWLLNEPWIDWKRSTRCCFFPAVMHVAIDISVTTIASKCGFVWKRNVDTNRNHNTLWKEPTSPRWSWLHLWIWFTLRRRNSTAVIDQHVPHFSMVSPIPNPCWTQGHAKLVEESSSGEEPPWCGDAQVMPGYATSFGIAAYHWQPKNYKIDHHEVLWISPVKSRNNFYPWGVLALAECSWAMVRAWNSGTNLRIQTGFCLLAK